MSNVTKHFDLKLKQKDIDFVDVVLNDDNKLFVDPRLIERSSHKADKNLQDHLYKFFANLLLSVGNRNKALKLLAGIEEPKETRLGYGKKNSKGKSAGPKIKEDLIDAILTNPVIKAKKISALGDMGFFIHNLGIDRISDITTKVIKHYLIDYTQKQCKKLGIPMQQVFQKGILDPATLTWTNGMVELPVYRSAGVDEPIIFVPKRFVNREGNANSSFKCFFRFARNFILDNGNGKFTRGLPRNGKDNTIRKKDFNASLGPVKDELSKWITEHPGILSDFWEISLDKTKPLSDDEIAEIVYGK